MKAITFASSFKRAYKSLARKRPDLKPKGEEEILLIDIGSHDEVY